MSTTQNSGKTSTARRDPLTEVVDIDSLRIAFDLIRANQNYVYWTTVSEPLRPLGRVRHEGVRQVATFALPLLALAAVYALLPLGALAFAVPAALLLGYALDRWLRRDIARQLRLDEDFDRGRYEATRQLSRRLGLRPDEITLERVGKMNTDFMTVAKRLHQEWQATHSGDAIREAARTANARFEARPRGLTRARTAGAVVAAAAPVVVAEDIAFNYDANGVADLSLYPEINPGNGLPMIAGTDIDVQGNTFGTDGAMF